MTAPLDYSQLSTWKNMSMDDACERIAEGNRSALSVCSDTFNMMTDTTQRAQFFLIVKP